MPALRRAAAALLAALLLAGCGASDPPPTSPFDPGNGEPTLPPGVETGTPPPLASPTADPDTPVTPTGTPVSTPLDEEQAAALAIELIAEWIAVPATDLAVAGVEQMEWPDACLDVYRPGVACAEVVTPGMRVELETLLRASVHVVHIAGPGNAAWVPEREVDGTVIAVDPVTSAIEVTTADGDALWWIAPGSIIEPPAIDLVPGTPVRAALDATIEGDMIVWLSEVAP